MNSKENNTAVNIHELVISESGSLGLLALGSLGLRAWRVAKEDAKKKKTKKKN